MKHCTHDDADKAPCPLCERDAEIARLLDRIKEATHVAAVHYSTLIHARAEQRMTIADRDRLAAENEQLRAGIEQEAEYCDGWIAAALLSGEQDRAARHKERAARLRALLA